MTKRKAIVELQGALNSRLEQNKLPLLIDYGEKCIDAIEQIKIRDLVAYPLCWKMDSVDYSYDYMGDEEWVMELHASNGTLITLILNKERIQLYFVGEYSIHLTSKTGISIWEDYRSPLSDTEKDLIQYMKQILPGLKLPPATLEWLNNTKAKTEKEYLKAINGHFGVKGEAIEIGWFFVRVKLKGRKGWINIQVRDVAKILLDNGFQLKLGNSFDFSLYNAFK